ncbi:MAG: hypothetical protein AB7T08_00235 [Hyphomonadaceae bacterium]
MKSKSRTAPKRFADDSTAMTNALDMLDLMRVLYLRPSKHHLKIGVVNYWPATGSIHVDGEGRKRRERGLRALEDLIRALRLDRTDVDGEETALSGVGVEF